MKVLNHVLKVPTSGKISYFWNFGSLLGFMLSVQIFSGVFLCLSFTASSIISFGAIDYMVRDIFGGDVVRKIHAKGATMFFLFLYLHTGRGMYVNSFKKNLHVWQVGMTIFLVSMAMAFLGYVLPWGQMSYWGATVITNLFGVFPLVGTVLVEWLWGGFSVNKSTLTRFFGLHVILPLVLAALVFIHILLLHSNGSSKPLGVKKKYFSFHPYWTVKDVLGVFFVVFWLNFMVFVVPYFFMDGEKFMEAKFMVTPIHIQPEWYFLPAYAVLRSIPKKMGGVLGLAMVFLVFYFKPLFSMKKMFSPFMNKAIYWLWVSSVVGLLWMGACVVEGLYMVLGQVFSVLYFVLVLLI